jgi:hypothetical protein
VLIAESSMKSKIRFNDYNNFRKYNVRRVVFDTAKVVLIAESSMKSKIRMNEYNNFRSYNVGRMYLSLLTAYQTVQHASTGIGQ